MAITKTGQELIKWAEQGGPVTPAAATPNKPGLFERFARGLGTAATTGMIAYNVASGEESLGEAVGGMGGMLLGYHIGDKIYNKYVPQIKPLVLPENTRWYQGLGKKIPHWLKTGLRGTGGFLAGTLASIPVQMVAGKIGDKILPWKREKPDYGYGPNTAYYEQE